MNKSDRRKPRIIIACESYLPYAGGGGGQRALVNIVDGLAEEFDFTVVTKYRPPDKGQLSDGTSVPDKWTRIGPAAVFHASKTSILRGAILQRLSGVEPDMIYLNSVFSTMTLAVLLGRLVGRFRGLPVIIAPCGELDPGSLTVKRLRKRLYLALARTFNLFDGLIWKAASELEAGSIQRHISAQAPVVIPELAGLDPETVTPSESLWKRKEKGSCRFIYLSRIARNKNLLWLLESFPDGPQGASLEVFGDADDGGYYQKCRLAARGCPRITFHAGVPHEKVTDTLAQFDVLVLPTLGENFGYVVLEAMAAGLPVLVSDRTPWTQIVNSLGGKGIDLDRNGWQEAMREFVEMGPDEFLALRREAVRFATDFIRNDPGREALRELFLGCLDRGGAQ